MQRNGPSPPLVRGAAARLAEQAAPAAGRAARALLRPAQAPQRGDRRACRFTDAQRSVISTQQGRRRRVTDEGKRGAAIRADEDEAVHVGYREEQESGQEAYVLRLGVEDAGEVESVQAGIEGYNEHRGWDEGGCGKAEEEEVFDFLMDVCASSVLGHGLRFMCVRSRMKLIYVLVGSPSVHICEGLFVDFVVCFEM